MRDENGWQDVIVWLLKRDCSGLRSEPPVSPYLSEAISANLPKDHEHVMVFLEGDGRDNGNNKYGKNWTTFRQVKTHLQNKNIAMSDASINACLSAAGFVHLRPPSDGSGPPNWAVKVEGRTVRNSVYVRKGFAVPEMHDQMRAMLKDLHGLQTAYSQTRNAEQVQETMNLVG